LFIINVYFFYIVALFANQQLFSSL
jgi:hypothetical protein